MARRGVSTVSWAINDQIPGREGEARRAAHHRRAAARKQCPMFQQRVSEAVRDALPATTLQPAFYHRLRLAESSAAAGQCKRAYREIGEAKRFGKRHQRRDEDE